MGGTTSVHYYAKGETNLILNLKQDLERSCKLSLVKDNSLNEVFPLLIFTEAESRSREAVNAVIADTPGGNGVCLILVHAANSRWRTRFANVECWDPRQDIGEVCIFYYNPDLTAHGYEKDNKNARKVLKRFLAQPLCIFHKVHCCMVHTDVRHEQEALQFVQNIGKLTLEQVCLENICHTRPLILFCFIFCPDEDDIAVEKKIMAILKQVTDWSCVFLVLISKPSTLAGLPFDTLRKQIGGYGTLVLSGSFYTGCHRQSEPNMFLIENLQRFLTDAMKRNT